MKDKATCRGGSRILKRGGGPTIGHWKGGLGFLPPKNLVCKKRKFGRKKGGGPDPLETPVVDDLNG